MRTTKFLAITFGIALAGTALVDSGKAQADLIFSANTVFNGASPTSTPPWLTATFSSSSAGTVILELKSSLDVASEFISEVTINLDSAITPSSLTITPDAGNTGFTAPTIANTTANAQNLVGGGSAGFGFDIKFSFSTSSGAANRFDGTDVAKFTITDTTITDASFNFTNTGSANAHIGAHIQGIPLDAGGTTSGAVKDGPVNAVPEPTALVLFGAGLAGFGFTRRKSGVA